jgi:hypothetical protein
MKNKRLLIVNPIQFESGFLFIKVLVTSFGLSMKHPCACLPAKAGRTFVASNLYGWNATMSAFMNYNHLYE